MRIVYITQYTYQFSYIINNNNTHQLYIIHNNTHQKLIDHIDHIIHNQYICLELLILLYCLLVRIILCYH